MKEEYQNFLLKTILATATILIFGFVYTLSASAQEFFFDDGINASITVTTDGATPVSIYTGGKVQGSATLRKDGNNIYSNAATSGWAPSAFVYHETPTGTSTVYDVVCSGTCGGNSEILAIVWTPAEGGGGGAEPIDYTDYYIGGIILGGIFLALYVFTLITNMLRTRV